MVTSEKHQKSLLGGIERLVGLEHPELIVAIPKILMEFYQADVLEEDVVTSWGTHVSKKYVDKETSKKVRKASEPFLKVNPSVLGQSFVLLIQYSGSRRLKTTKMKTRIETGSETCVYRDGGFGCESNPVYTRWRVSGYLWSRLSVSLHAQTLFLELQAWDAVRVKSCHHEMGRAFIVGVGCTAFTKVCSSL